MLSGVRQRAQERAREELRNRPDARRAPGPAAAAAAAPQPTPRPGPDWPVEIRLSNGRRLRAVLTPAAARRSDLAAFGRVSAANDRQALAAIQRQGEALESLKRSHEELARKVAALQEQADRALIGLLQGLTGFEQRLQAVKAQGQELLADRLAARTLAARQGQKLRSLAVTARIQQVTAVVNSTQAAAYGQRGSVLATNNLLLAGNQLFWTFIDPLLRSVGISGGASPSLVTWLAPLGSLVTGHLALGNRQHLRFISGVASFEGKTRVFLEPLRSRIADGLWPEFQRRTDVPVTTAWLEPMPGLGLAAAVRQGVLLIAIVPIDHDPAPTGRVAWMVDTGVDVG